MPVVINGSTGISGTDGSAATPAYQGTDTNTGLLFPAADTVAIATGGSERVRVDSSGNMAVRTTTATSPITVGRVDSSSEGGQIDFCRASDNANAWGVDVFGSTSTPTLRFVDNVAASVRASIDGSGNFAFNSGYGSAATAYGCRAWVNFNGTGVVAIRASGNVTSITDNGTGDYTVNFTNAMPDTNYSTVFGSAVTWNQTNGDQGWANLRSNNGGTSPQQTGSVRVWTSSKASSIGTPVDIEQINIAVFR